MEFSMSYKIPITSNSNFGAVKIGTGLIVSNGVLSASTGLLNYGFFTAGTQNNPIANAINIGSFNATGPTNGITLVSNTAVTVANAGTYIALFTANISKTSVGPSSISMWLRYNGVDIAGSRQDTQLVNTLSTLFTSGNYTLNMLAGSNLQLCWSSPDTTVTLTAIPAGVSPVRPSGNSLRITLTRIS